MELTDGDSDVCGQLVQCGVAVKENTGGVAPSAPIISQVQLSAGKEYSVYIAYSAVYKS